ERVPDDNPDETGMPDLWFVLPETIVVVDNVRKTAAIVRHVHVDPDTDLARAYAAATAGVEAVAERMREPLPAEPRSALMRAPMDVRRSVTREQFHESVKRAKEYIEAGDIFQVVLSQQFRIPLQVDPFTIYRHLRVINPSPYLFFLRCEGPVLIGSSPEILVRLEDDRIDVRPIAGTRPRGRAPGGDGALGPDLLADAEEAGEHGMRGGRGAA